MSRTNFISLDLIESGNVTMGQLIQAINENSRLIDQHDHSTGRGRKIPLSSVLVNTFLDMDQRPLLDVGYIKMINRNDPSLTNNSIYFKDGELYVRDGSGREIQISREGQSGINIVTLGPSETANFQVPILVATTLTVATANTIVYHNLASLSGVALPGKITPSVVNGIARVTIGEDGYINLIVEDEIQINSSTAGGAGGVGEFVFNIRQYSASGTIKRSWSVEHVIEDPITRPIKFPISKIIGLTPVKEGDFFTFRFSFNSSQANRNVVFQLPANTPAYEERMEFIFFPLQVGSKGETGAQGLPGPQGPVGPRGATGQPGTPGESGVRRFTQLDDTPNSYDDPGQLVLVSGGRDELVFGSLGFTALNDTPENIEGNKYLRGKLDNTGLEWVEEPHASQGIIAKQSRPTDLSKLVNGQVIPVNDPSSGKWYEVEGADSDEKHGFSVDFEADPNNPAQNTWLIGSELNFGYSGFGDIYGKIYTEDRGKPLPNDQSPIMRMEFDVEVARVPSGQSASYGFTANLTCLIRKSELSSAPSSIFVRFYTGIPGSRNQVTTIELVKSPDNPQHDYHTYLERPGTSVPSDMNDILSIKYFRFFTSTPPTEDQTSNPLELHRDKRLTEFDPPGLSQANVPQQFRSDADQTGGLFQPGGFWSGTQADFNALTKDPNTIYFIT